MGNNMQDICETELCNRIKEFYGDIEIYDFSHSGKENDGIFRLCFNQKFPNYVNDILRQLHILIMENQELQDKIKEVDNIVDSNIDPNKHIKMIIKKQMFGLTVL